MSALIDLTGKRFNRLVVIKRAPNKTRDISWFVRCDCGKEKVTKGSCLRSGGAMSCGCYNREITSKRSFLHGLGKTSTYQCWVNMWSRCRNPSARDFKNYGARGITVCDRWKNFLLFLEDMGERPPVMTLERIDNNKGYSPDNCKWATRAEQAANTRRARYLTFNGKTMLMSEWDRILGLSAGRVRKRLKEGWPLEKALSLSK